MDRGNACNGSVPSKKSTKPICQSVIDDIQSVCVCVCLCVCVCVFVCLCVCVFVCVCEAPWDVGAGGRSHMKGLGFSTQMQGAGTLPGGLLPTRTPPRRVKTYVRVSKKSLLQPWARRGSGVQKGVP